MNNTFLPLLITLSIIPSCLPQHSKQASASLSTAKDAICWQGWTVIHEAFTEHFHEWDYNIRANSSDPEIALWGAFDFCTGISSSLEPDNCMIFLRKRQAPCATPGFKFQEKAESIVLNNLDSEIATQFRAKASTLESSVNSKILEGDLSGLIGEAFTHLHAMQNGNDKFCAGIITSFARIDGGNFHIFNSEVLLDSFVSPSQLLQFRTETDRNAQANCQENDTLLPQSPCLRLEDLDDDATSQNTITSTLYLLKGSLALKDLSESDQSGTNPYPNDCSGKPIRQTVISNIKN